MLWKGRAVEFFNTGNRVANDLLQLKPTLENWVPHVLAFIDPQQAVLLGDPTNRSCDACESFGAMLKKIIKHNTCRRSLTDPVPQTISASLGMVGSGAGSRHAAKGTFRQHLHALQSESHCSMAKRTLLSFNVQMHVGRRSGRPTDTKS